jgi:hypothetical protein
MIALCQAQYGQNVTAGYTDAGNANSWYCYRK